MLKNMLKDTYIMTLSFLAPTFLLLYLSKPQYKPNPADKEPGWMQPLQVVNRKLDVQAEQIKVLQDDVLTLENETTELRRQMAACKCGETGDNR